MCINHGRAKYLPPVDIQTGRQTLEKKNTLEHLNGIFIEGRPSKMTLPESLKHLDIVQMNKITKKESSHGNVWSVSHRRLIDP